MDMANLGIYLDDDVQEALDQAVKETTKRTRSRWSRSKYLNVLLAKTLHVEKPADIYVPPPKPHSDSPRTRG